MIQIDLSISLTTAERNAWQTLKPKIKTHMSKVLRIYRRANPEQKAVIRAHCPVLDAVLDAIGE